MVFSSLLKPHQSGSMGEEGEDRRRYRTTSFAYPLSIPCSSLKKHCTVTLQPVAKLLTKCTLVGLKWPVHDLLPLSKLPEIQEHAQNLQEQLGMYD